MFTNDQESMMVDMGQQENDTENLKPFIAPCNKLEFSAPIRWLKLAWEDYHKAKLASIHR